jgi:hypothetical protein
MPVKCYRAYWLPGADIAARLNHMFRCTVTHRVEFHFDTIRQFYNQGKRRKLGIASNISPPGIRCIGTGLVETGNPVGREELCGYLIS